MMVHHRQGKHPAGVAFRAGGVMSKEESVERVAFMDDAGTMEARNLEKPQGWRERVRRRLAGGRGGSRWRPSPIGTLPDNICPSWGAIPSSAGSGRTSGSSRS
jgi:hypothetical protein